MTTLREAAQQALEALNRSDYLGWQLNIPIIKALKAALAEPDYWEEEARRYASNADYWRKRCVSCGGALPATGQDDRTGECVCGEPPAFNTVHRTDGPCYVAEPDWQDLYLKEKKRADMWRDKYESVAGAEQRIYPLAEPVQQGCDHCNHPLYAAVKCRVCGRVTEPVQEPVWVCPDSAEHRYGKPGHCEDCGKTLVQVAEPVQERNFCPRCGKRTNDIHTCTPPQAEPEGDALTAAYMLGRYDGKRKPLTTEEVELLWFRCNWTGKPNVGFAREIEKAHGIV